MSTAPTPRPRPARRPPARKIRLTLAMLVAAVAVLGGIVVGYAAHGDPAAGGLVTETRSVPVVTLTVPGPAPAPVTVTVTAAAEATETAPASTTGTAPEVRP